MKKEEKKAQAIADTLGTASNEELLRRERRANSAWSKLRRNKTAMVGLFIVCAMIFIAVFAPLLSSQLLFGQRHGVLLQGVGEYGLAYRVGKHQTYGV